MGGEEMINVEFLMLNAGAQRKSSTERSDRRD